MAEITGAVAIIVTLVILIFEVRVNTGEVRAATLSSIAGRTQEVNLLKVRNLQFAEESFISNRDGRLDEDVWLTRGTAALLHIHEERSKAMYLVIRDRGSLTTEFTNWLDAAFIETYGE